MYYGGCWDLEEAEEIKIKCYADALAFHNNIPELKRLLERRKLKMTDEPIPEEEEMKDLETGPIELPRLDVSKYIGRKTKVAKAGIYKGQYGYFIRFETEPLDKIRDLEITSTTVLGLQQDANGKIGWGAGTKMDLFLKKYGVEHWKAIIGKEVIVQTRLGNDGKEYLTFN